jgi:hypothetical protein
MLPILVYSRLKNNQFKGLMLNLVDDGLSILQYVDTILFRKMILRGLGT